MRAGVGPRSPSRRSCGSCADASGVAFARSRARRTNLVTPEKLLDHDRAPDAPNSRRSMAGGDGLVAPAASRRRSRPSPPPAVGLTTSVAPRSRQNRGRGRRRRRCRSVRRIRARHQRLEKASSPRSRPARAADRRRAPLVASRSASRRRAAPRVRDDEVGRSLSATRTNAVVIVDGDGRAFGVPGDPRIAGRGHEPRQPRALRELPRQRVLASAAADEQDIHSPPSVLSTTSRCARAMRAHGLPASSSR